MIEFLMALDGKALRATIWEVAAEVRLSIFSETTYGAPIRREYGQLFIPSGPPKKGYYESTAPPG